MMSFPISLLRAAIAVIRVEPDMLQAVMNRRNEVSAGQFINKVPRRHLPAALAGNGDRHQRQERSSPNMDGNGEDKRRQDPG